MSVVRPFVVIGIFFILYPTVLTLLNIDYVGTQEIEAQLNTYDAALPTEPIVEESSPLGFISFPIKFFGFIKEMILNQWRLVLKVTGMGLVTGMDTMDMVLSTFFAALEVVFILDIVLFARSG